MKKNILSCIRRFQIAVFWLSAVVIFLLSFGRVPELLHSFYQFQSLSDAIGAIVGRPIPMDAPALFYGFILVAVSLLQITIFKENWVSFQFLSLKLFIWSVLFLIIGDAVGWSAHWIMTPQSQIFWLCSVILYISLGAVILSVIFVRKLEALNITSKSNIFGAFVWWNQALFLTAIQVLAIGLIRH